MRLFSRCTPFNPRCRNLDTMHCQVPFSLIGFHRGIFGFRSHRKNLFEMEAMSFSKPAVCAGTGLHYYGMIGIGQGLGNFIVVFPESVVCAPASLAYLLPPAADRNGVNLLFTWHKLLFCVWWCSTTERGYCELVGRVARASYGKTPC